MEKAASFLSFLVDGGSGSGAKSNTSSSRSGVILEVVHVGEEEASKYCEKAEGTGNLLWLREMQMVIMEQGVGSAKSAGKHHTSTLASSSMQPAAAACFKQLGSNNCLHQHQSGG
ncbi:unnamed protein product [Urochloa humidicola]